MNARSLALLLLIPAALGVSLTGYYVVHESLPRVVRAPTSLILAPVAIVDGLCHAIGVPGIYGRIVPVLVVNWAFGVAICCGAVGVGRWRKARMTANSDPGDARRCKPSDSAGRWP